MSKSQQSYFEFTTLDVFTDTLFSGNPLAVVRVPKELSSSLTQERKQLIAREFNFSETVFFHQQNDQSLQAKIDIFTTATELPFAGHPTIGSICFLMSHGALNSPLNHDNNQQGTIMTKAGEIPVSYQPISGLASAQIPHNVHIHEGRFSLKNLLPIQPNFIEVQSYLPAAFPIVSIVKGMTFILLELPDIKSLACASTTSIHINCTLDKGWESSFIGSYYFVKESQIGDSCVLRTRMIEGSLEDPATGSAASALAAFLSIDAKRPNTEFTYKLIQGVEMGRRSEIGVKVKTNTAGDGVDVVTLSGKAIIVSEGRIQA